MPLLKKQHFERATIPENLRDDEEIFYCTATGEIFRDYETFSERMFLCNSMIWTCSLTGKSNLTYTEALESEKNANKSLEEFPTQLKVPAIYLATRTKRTAFGDMAEDVFLYMKDRFFIGETIETCFTGAKWEDSHVLQVIAPSPDQIKAASKNGSVEDCHLYVPAHLYKYEIEHLDAYDKDISEMMIVDCNQIKRKKGLFSREKCKLFLKQYVEQDARGIFVIKSSAKELFNIDKISFENIFNGPPPEFDASKKFEKVVNGKKTRQESLHKFLTKHGSFAKNTNNDLLEKIRKREEEYKLIKQQKKEKKIELKQKKKKENILLANHLRTWYQPKEDFELVDQKKLPRPTPVKLKVPKEHLGDMFMVLEFVHTFSKVLSTKDFFPHGISVEIMERALTENEVAGPFVDFIQMFLNALFNVQEEETRQYRTETENPSHIIKQDDVSNNMNVREATRLATIASKWSKEFQGVPLVDLPLYSLTTSEILRLHLLGSGAIINMTGARWRYQQRGGYTSEDDPGLYLRLHTPHILKALKFYNVVELPISDKITILSCLMNQLLTYADVRDIVEERMETIKQTKIDYKVAVTAEKKREQEFLTTRYKMRKLAKDDLEVANELQKLELEAQKKKEENERKIEELRKAMYDKQVVMGQDRAFRQYLRLESVPGFFVSFEEQNMGTCLTKITEQIPYLVNATRDETAEYLKKTLPHLCCSDKENSPSKISKKVNGIHNGVLEQNVKNCDELMLCSANPETCIVHNRNRKMDTWSFYHDVDTLNQLIEALNKRGIREHELQQNLRFNREEIENLIINTPVNVLNIELDHAVESRLRKLNRTKYENANLGYPTDMNTADVLLNILIENILEMEEKIFSGNLGLLNVKDREKWRNCLQNKNYKELDKTLVMKDHEKNTQLLNDAELNSDQLTSSRPDAIPDIDNNDVLFVLKEDLKEAIHTLSIALAQVAESVELKFLEKPLGRVSKGRSDRKKENMLNKWVQSLLACTSFSQLFLHYSTLDSCVIWSRSVLLARCRICRRKNDSENMLLCDSCNLGQHMYCLKPQLKSVPTGDWFCVKCQKDQKREAVVELPPKKRPIFRDEEIDAEEQEGSDAENEDLETDDDEQVDKNEMSEVTANVELCQTCGSGGEVISCEKCLNHYHIECAEPPLRRAPRGPWLCGACKRNNDRKRNYDSSEEEVISKRTTRRDEGRSDLPLHNSALHAVLSEVMKDSNAWPFLRPVQKTEVPDYYDVITKPMDFGTIKYKLNMGEYHEDAQFMSDALLVFQNCNTYNHTEDDVYKCGVRLLKHFQKKCRELGLKLPEEMDYNGHSPCPRKKIRTN